MATHHKAKNQVWTPHTKFSTFLPQHLGVTLFLLWYKVMYQMWWWILLFHRIHLMEVFLSYLILPLLISNTWLSLIHLFRTNFSKNKTSVPQSRHRHTGYTINSQEEWSPPDNGLNIINLSPYILSKDEITVLKKGQSFCPSKDLDKF